MICNAPWAFTALWTIAKGWVDEKTRQKINILGGSYLKELLKFIDEDQLSHVLGGKHMSELIEDNGPWNDYEIVDGTKPGDVVGVKKTGDPEGKIFTVQDMAALPNMLIPE